MNVRLIDANLLVARLKEDMRNKLDSPVALDNLYGAIDGLLADMVEWCPTVDTDYCPWHDLRKDPDDLPPSEDYVMVCYDGKEYGYEYYIASYRRYMNPITGTLMDDVKWWMYLPQYSLQKNVIAWKAIERFDKDE